MKKLNRLQINSKKLIENEELMTIRGGYSAYIRCVRPDGGNCGRDTYSCDYVEYECDMICPGWEWSICVGG